MKRLYKRPELTEYGQIHELTLGSSGDKLDFNFVGGVLVPADPASCSTNGPPACVNFSQ